MLSKYILIGQVLRPQGVEGLVKVRPDTDDPNRFLALTHIFLKNGEVYTRMDISDVLVRDGFVFLRLNGAQTRNDAESQRGLMLYVNRENARKLAPNEFFICDLVGCKAYDTLGNELGTLTDVMRPGANDVYVFATPRGEMLVPALNTVVLSTDVENGRIVLDEKKLPEMAIYEA